MSGLLMNPGWETTDKKAYVISSDVFNILCGVFTFLYGVRFMRKGADLSMIKDDFYYSEFGLFEPVQQYVGRVKKSFDTAPSRTSKVIGCILLVLGITAFVMGIIRMIYDSIVDWNVLDEPVPEQPQDPNLPVDFSLPETA